MFILVYIVYIDHHGGNYNIAFPLVWSSTIFDAAMLAVVGHYEGSGGGGGDLGQLSYQYGSQRWIQEI
jgi:ABC-type methionine transport system permease subunit